jgi:membrane fusion protein, copper/silver efflux system
MNTIKNLLFIIALLSFFSCKREVKEEPNVFYTCSMDPQVMEKKPGNCPICKMELSKTIINESDRNTNVIKLSETQIKLANIIVEEVNSSFIGDEVSLRGTVVPDAGKMKDISTRVGGRIEKLYFKSPGENIKAGDHIYDIYSEDLEAALNQYLALKDKAMKLKNAEVDYNELLSSAKEKLLLLDITEKQLKTLSIKKSSASIPYYSKASGVISSIAVKEGDYINEGSVIYNLADLSALWVEAEVYAQDEFYLSNNSEVNLRISGFPENIKGRISFVNPELEKDSKINLVRIEISNKEKKYKPGMQVTINIESNKKKNIVIPANAILTEKTGYLVWIENTPGAFEPRIVTLGIQNKDESEIVSGLAQGDKVVISGAYLLNSEYTLKKGSTAWENLTGMKVIKNNDLHHHH